MVTDPLLTGTPWSIRLARAWTGAPALELYHHTTLLDILITTSIHPELLRGTQTTPHQALAWGHLPTPPAPTYRHPHTPAPNHSRGATTEETTHPRNHRPNTAAQGTLTPHDRAHGLGGGTAQETTTGAAHTAIVVPAGAAYSPLTVSFTRGRFRPVIHPAEITLIGNAFWLAIAHGTYNAVILTNDGHPTRHRLQPTRPC